MSRTIRRRATTSNSKHAARDGAALKRDTAARVTAAAIQSGEDSRAGWRLRDWLAATSVGRSTFYVLPAEIAPRQVRLGKKVVVIEAPAAWLDRVAKAGGAPRLRVA